VAAGEEPEEEEAEAEEEMEGEQVGAVLA